MGVGVGSQKSLIGKQREIEQEGGLPKAKISGR